MSEQVELSDDGLAASSTKGHRMGLGTAALMIDGAQGLEGEVRP
jgi:hypothetical protein